MRKLALAGASCLLAVFGCKLTAGEAGADTTAVRRFQLPEPMVVVRLNDTVRSRERYAATPYAAFMSTPSGTMLKGQIQQQIQVMEGNQPGVLTEAIAAVKAGMFCVQMKPEDFGRFGPEPTVQAAVDFTDPAKLFALADQHGMLEPVAGAEIESWREEDMLVQKHGSVLAMVAHPDGVEAIAQLDEVPPALDPDADLEVVADFTSFYKGMAKMIADGNAPPDANLEDLKLLEGFEVRVTSRLTGFGIRERITYTMPAMGEVLAAHDKKVTKQAFDSLPATAVWALAWQADPDMTAQAFALLPAEFKEEGIGHIDDELAKLGLPSYEELLTSFDGLGLAWMESLDGKPVITLEQETAEEVGQNLAQVITDQMAGAECPPEMEAFLGYAIELQAAYQDGKLILTTHPEGVQAVTTRDSGFTAKPAVQAALAELPAEAMSLGVSDGPASWKLVGELVLKGLGESDATAAFVDLLATLPDDLARSAEFGYLYSDVEGEGAIFIEGGGMLSPLTGYVGGMAGFGLYMFWQFQRAMREMGGPMPAPGGGGGGGAPPPPPAF